jgi:hypothetical protein
MTAIETNTERYHPDIERLAKTKIDNTYSKGSLRYSGRDDEFFIVPTEMIVERYADKSLWKNCPSLVNYDILDCINEIIASGEYPYNSSVGDLFAKKFNTPPHKDGTFLSAMVYCTQQYKSSKADEESAKAFHELMAADGFVKATEEWLIGAVGTNRKFMVVLDTAHYLIGGKTTAHETKLILKNWGEQELYWMNPRATKSGYRASAGQYVKECK